MLNPLDSASTVSVCDERGPERVSVTLWLLPSDYFSFFTYLCSKYLNAAWFVFVFACLYRPLPRSCAFTYMPKRDARYLQKIAPYLYAVFIYCEWRSLKNDPKRGFYDGSTSSCHRCCNCSIWNWSFGSIIQEVRRRIGILRFIVIDAAAAAAANDRIGLQWDCCIVQLVLGAASTRTPVSRQFTVIIVAMVA